MTTIMDPKRLSRQAAILCYNHIRELNEELRLHKMRLERLLEIPQEQQSLAAYCKKPEMQTILPPKQGFCPNCGWRGKLCKCGLKIQGGGRP